MTGAIVAVAGAIQSLGVFAMIGLSAGRRSGKLTRMRRAADD
jgi:hypothetical protein